MFSSCVLLAQVWVVSISGSVPDGIGKNLKASLIYLSRWPMSTISLIYNYTGDETDPHPASPEPQAILDGLIGWME
jgi:hypothetical protein